MTVMGTVLVPGWALAMGGEVQDVECVVFKSMPQHMEMLVGLPLIRKRGDRMVVDQFSAVCTIGLAVEDTAQNEGPCGEPFGTVRWHHTTVGGDVRIGVQYWYCVLSGMGQRCQKGS